MLIGKLAGMLASFVLVSMPFFAGAEDYISPSVMPIWQNSTAPELLNYSNHSYTDRPFDKVVSKVSLGYFLSGDNVVYQITVNVKNQNTRFVSINSVPSYCRIGSNDCKPFSCKYYSNRMYLEPSGSKETFCTITADQCAGREIVMEYTMQGVKGSITTKNIVPCPQKFCDQVTVSMKTPKIYYAGDRVIAEGYFSVIGGEGMPSPIVISIGKYKTNTNSNDFGYWRAPIEVDAPGLYEISAVSESCGRESKSSVQVLSAEEKPFNYTLSVYPKNLDVEIGSSALLAIQNNGDVNITVSLSGVPSDWVEPPEFSAGRGIKFVYVYPKNPGSYMIKISSGSEEVYVNLFVAEENRVKQVENNDIVGFFVLLAGAFFLYRSKRTGKSENKKSGYLDDVKNEIENNGNWKVSVHGKFNNFLCSAGFF
ncbi:MAG: hypothetical protein HYT71_04150 [Candidatus Aenigmarchaeota archaeon]|nr:hypothetical protein [Candidatus Aenigmarchaeota archaeon]